MSESKEKGKKEKEVYDENGGLYAIRNWPPVLRWICILPAVVIVILLAKGGVSFFVSTIERNFSETAGDYVSSFLMCVCYIVAIDVAGAVAPTKRTLVSIVTAFILGALTILANIYLYSRAIDNHVTFGIHNYICMGISFVSIIFGLFMGVNITKERQKKALENSN